MVRRIEPRVLIFGRNAKKLGHFQDEEDEAGGDTGPGGNREETDNLNTELLSTASHQGAVIISALSIHTADELLVGKKAGGDETPHTTEEVDGRRVKRVVNLKLEEELGGTIVNKGSNETDDNGSPSVDNRAGASDGDKTSKDAIQRRGDIWRIS